MYKVKNWVAFLTLFFICIIQATALNYFVLFGVKPDLLLICVIYFGFYFEKKTSIKIAILAGAFKDITTTALLGSNVFAFCLCALFLAHFGNHFYKNRVPTRILLGSLLYCAAGFVVFIINYAKDIYICAPVYFWVIFKTSLYTGCVLPILFFIFNKIFDIAEKSSLAPQDR